MIGTIIKIIGDIYIVLLDGEKVTCSVRKTAKNIRLVVGDRVELIANDYEKDKYVIVKSEHRDNFLVRPPIANIDKLLIVIAPEPKPDLLLVDKLIIYCLVSGIEPVIVINKGDISTSDFVEGIAKQYYSYKTFSVSATKGSNIDSLTKYISNTICAVCGQSAVGKSSLINALIPDLDLETQELSSKISRGKHTTRVNEIYINNDLRIADTPGFSSLELKVSHKELALFYPEFDEYLGKCKYQDCSHIKEGSDCAINSAVSEGRVSLDRYNRYVDLYNKLLKDWKEKYD